MAKKKEIEVSQTMDVYVLSCPDGVIGLAPDLASAYCFVDGAGGASLIALDPVETGGIWSREYLHPLGHPKERTLAIRIQRFPLKVPGISLYAVRNKQGRYFRRKGYGGSGSTWVDSFADARIFPRIGAAKSVITFFSNADNNPQYANYPVPDLLEMVIGTSNVIDQTKRLAAFKKRKETAAERLRLRRAQDEANRLQRQLDDAKRRADDAQRALQNAQNALNAKRLAGTVAPTVQTASH